MFGKVIIGRDTLDEMQRSEPVRKALLRKAARILPRAQRLAAEAGAIEFSRSLQIVSGIRPGTKSPRGYKRAFVQVIATSDDAEDLEHGNAGVNKQAILRRSIGA
ncbi:hypothetical protein [Curtobacterium sp. MCBD17_028]|uniref:hypothetical protein n=1 Tax=Curtobacterium sp. MCBD17_028 TaxID=2175670 RepID=UPI000DA83395|nr:hypothetical protein [Curtobacterium sp. MCBD17_028]PZE23858.1 hypothetical protein DEI86_13515 [Curtobacterium sp. MCBD17_028]